MTAARTGWGIAWTRPGTNTSISSTRLGRDEAGQLGLRARLDGHGGPRAAGADREARRTSRPRGWPSRSRPAPGCRSPRTRSGRRTRPTSRSCRRWRRARCRRRPRRGAGGPRVRASGAPAAGNPGAARRSTVDAARREIEDDRQRDRRRRRRRGCPGACGRTPLEAEDDDEAQEPDPERPARSSGRGSAEERDELVDRAHRRRC